MKFCSIASGSSGNCIYVGTDSTSILVDAGISCKRITEGLKDLSLKPEEIDGIFITHEHSDHTKGLGVLSRKYGIPLYGSPGTIQYLKNNDSLGKVDESVFHEIQPETTFTIGDMEINPMEISHDAAQPVCYRIQNDRKSMAIVTDLGTYDAEIVDKLQQLDGILLEANHDIRMLQVGRYPYYLKQRILGDRGHLSNELSGQLLGELLHDHFGTIMLGHLSHENNYPQLAYETVKLEVAHGSNPYGANDFPIKVAKRDEPSEMIYL